MQSCLPLNCLQQTDFIWFYFLLCLQKLQKLAFSSEFYKALLSPC